MTPGLFEAIFAGVTLLILWTGSTAGLVIWFMRFVTQTKEEILRDFNKKHDSNAQTVKALEALVIRHDVLLNPEFNGQGQGNRNYLRS